jgi:hypothetical protein
VGMQDDEMDGWRGVSTLTCAHTSVGYCLAHASCYMLARAGSSRHASPLGGCDVLIALRPLLLSRMGATHFVGAVAKVGGAGWCV